MSCFRFIARELSRVGDVIGQVKAVDKDSVKQTKVFYMIARGNEKGMQQSCYLFVYDFVVQVKASRIKSWRSKFDSYKKRNMRSVSITVTHFRTRAISDAPREFAFNCCSF